MRTGKGSSQESALLSLQEEYRHYNPDGALQQDEVGRWYAPAEIDFCRPCCWSPPPGVRGGCLWWVFCGRNVSADAKARHYVRFIARRDGTWKAILDYGDGPYLEAKYANL